MKLGIVVIVAGIGLCAAGCQSVVKRFENSVTHMAGAVTDTDVTAALFSNHIQRATAQVIVIDYCLLKPVDVTHRRGALTYWCVPEIGGGQRDAFIALDAITSSRLFTPPCVTNTMAVLLSSAEYQRPRQVYKLLHGQLPVYVVSSEIVAGGAIQHDLLSSNILHFATTSFATNDPAGDRWFPFKFDSDYRREIRMDDPFNEFRVYKKGPRKFGDAWMSAAEVTEYQQRVIPQMLTVSWPQILLPPPHGDTDILLLSWCNMKGVETKSSADKRAFGKSNDPNRCSRISGRDGIVYYHKTRNMTCRLDVPNDLREMNADYQRVALPQR